MPCSVFASNSLDDVLLPQHDALVRYVQRLDRLSGFKTALNARLKNDFPHHQPVGALVGDGPNADRLDELISQFGTGDSVVEVGQFRKGLPVLGNFEDAMG